MSPERESARHMSLIVADVSIVATGGADDDDEWPLADCDDVDASASPSSALAPSPPSDHSLTPSRSAEMSVEEATPR